MALLVIAACGGGDDVDDSTAELTCERFSFCTTYDASDETVPAPTERGGVIADGIYRLERGTFGGELLVFEGDQILQIGDGFANQLGTYTTQAGTISFTYATSCDRDGTTAAPLTWADRPYLADGDRLQIGLADSFDGEQMVVVWYEFRRLAGISDACTETAQFSCQVSNCSCAVVSDGFGTVESGVKVCSAR